MARSSSPSTPPLAMGMRLDDRFEVLGVLGEGGAGTVYDALRLPEREQIALKVLHGHLLGDRQFRGRFEREARILRRLEGPHVCPVLDSGELADPRDPSRRLVYMALPKIDGPALDAVLRREGVLSTSRALDVILQVLDALRMAHEQGVVHRDLKPANVLLKGGSHVIVVDFGLAKILTGDVAATVLTAHNMVCGTPEYMAPEQARGDEIDARCDLYAAGVMLYQMLTGSPPFVGPTALSVLTAHLTSTPVPPREKAPDRDISPALQAVVLHAMAKDPGDRYSTAAEMAAAVLHARATPDTLAAVHPESLRVRLDGDGEVDGHGPTVPDLLNAPTAPTPTPAPAPPRQVSASAPAPGFQLGPTGWKIVWIVATLASICLGAWLSLRTP
jgi:eukaryotic-like serine/threonine-protein kinase